MTLTSIILTNLPIFWGIYDWLKFTLTCIIIYVVNFYFKYYTRVNPLPGPFPIPIIGTLYALKGGIGNGLLLLQKQYGEIFEVWYLSNRRIILGNVEYIDNLLTPSTKSKYLKRNVLNEGLKELGISFQGIINNCDINIWKYNRHFFNQAILSPSFNNKSIELTHKLWYDMEKYLNHLNDENIMIDLSSWMHRYSTDMIVEIITGRRSYSLPIYYNTLSKKENKEEIPSVAIKESEELIHRLHYFLRNLPIFVFLPYWIRHYVPIIKDKTKDALTNRDWLFQRILTIVKERRKEIEEITDDKLLNNDMLTLLIIANTQKVNNVKDHSSKLIEEKFSRPMTDQEIMSVILDAFIGGSDTTSHFMCFIVYRIAKNIKVLKRLRQELDSIYGQDRTRHVTSEDLINLKYTEAIIKETARVLSVAPIILRVNSEDDEVAGYKWPTNTAFTMHFAGIHHNERYWKDPEEFNPDRFMYNEEIKNSLIIFGGGLRACPARKMSMVVLKCLMVLIYRKYDVELIDKDAPLDYTSTIINTCNKLPIKIKLRQD
ncbi:cytochrome P450 [Glomus cerebriforme]|uniref:Cytochrome P450 n=1 Tax=Glomus cerebriforme TaxID=658196 RepID=A0A397TWN8_9GLOM|nr:cytochrome P450 [Glomus cerebriforme]